MIDAAQGLVPGDPDDLPDLSRLTPEEAEALEAILRGDKSLLDAMLAEEYEEIPVSPEQFFTDPYYLGNTGADLYPRLMDDLIEVFTGNYTEVILGGSIGWGKSTLTEFGLLRLVYETCCLRNPQRSFGLMEGTSIYVVNISVTESQARKAIFGGIRAKVMQSPFFKDVIPYDKNVTTELRFPKNITIFPGASTDNSILGLNVIGGALDEGNFMPVRETKNLGKVETMDKAQRLYTSMLRRIKSRFLREGHLPGKLFAISSAQYPGDFIDRRVREAIHDPSIFVRSYALWDVKRDAYSTAEFKVEVGSDFQGSRILTGDEDPESVIGQVISVPVDFHQDFERDIDGAIRDIGGISTLTVDQFIKNFGAVMKCVDGTRGHPWTSESTTLIDGSKLYRKQYLMSDDRGKPKLRFHPDAPRVAHIDPSLSGDATGVAVGHIVEMVKVERRQEDGTVITETAPLIFYDLLLRIVPPKGGEIPLDRVRDILYAMVEDGMNIRLVTMDRFQSAEAMQQFRKRGIAADLLSVDKDMAPYEMLRQAFYEERVNMYHYDPALGELRRLEHDRKKAKVDHPDKGSKDVSDAMAAVAYTLTVYSGRLYKPQVVAHTFG